MRPIAPLVLALALVPGLAPRDGEPPQVLTAERLGGEDRWLTHVSTDKPIYRIGETVYARGVVLHARTRAPRPSVDWIPVQVIGPKGDVVHEGQAMGTDGVAAFSWIVPDGQAGGLYRLTFGGPDLVPGERTFEVRAFRAPRIKSQIVFMRDGYGPGDEVLASLQATRAEGGAPAGAALTLVAIVDGEEVARQPAGTLDALGRAHLRFRLPGTIERGEGTLAVVMEDGGVVETASKTIPILLRHVDLAAYPEGGDLVAGIPSRVYVQARTPADKPADVAGTIETRAGVVVARFRTEHEGRGRVRLTPVAGESYRIRITEPAGIATTLDLPSVSAKGGSISTFEDVTKAGEPLRLRVAATPAGAYDLTVSLRESEIARERVKLDRGELRHVMVSLPEDASGVLRVTLWSDDGWPIAERLAFRAPAGEVKVELTCDRSRYVPAGQVELRIRTTGADGRPVPAMVGLSVSDDSVRELLETRDQPPQLPVQVLVESDVLELADAAVYLNPSDARAPRAMDLLLGTQGWRRFAFVSDPAGFVDGHGDAARRVLALPEGGGVPIAWADAEAVLDAIEERGVEGGVVGGVIGGVINGLGAAVPRRAPEPPMEAIAKDERPLPAAAPLPERKPDVAAASAAPAIGARERDDFRAAGKLAADMPVAQRRAPARQAIADADVGERKRRNEVVVPVRVYAHAVRADRRPGDRVDFTDTVYWNAGVMTDAKGEARVGFALSDSVTSFRVLADAFTRDGALGAGTRLLDSVEPFYLEPKLPLEISSGDVVRLPITAVNGTTDAFDVTLRASLTGPLSAGTLAGLKLPAGDRVRSLVRLVAGDSPGTARLTIDGVAGEYRDSVTRELRVAPLGFPSSQSFGGTLAAGGRAVHEIVVPRDLVAGSVRTSAQVFPTSLGKLTGALERLIQEPYGCFEQTSSTTYPLVMAQQYFTTHAGVDPSLVTRSQELLDKGYERLISFETPAKGYEWFGEAPGHEALSAFGLLEFTDMSRVRTVDTAMLARTREWILATRDGKGGFKRERRALHAWIEDADCSNAYITWSLLEAGEPAASLAPEVDALGRAARASGNGYVHALAANVMQLAGRSADAATFLGKLAGAQDASGRVTSGTSSIVGSSGDALEIETTALATLAWLRSPAHQAQVEKSIRWLAESCQGGRYGSTQSTVLALRAIVAYDARRSAPRAGGSLVVTVDGKAVGAPVPFGETTDGALVLPDFGAALRPGTHRVELVMEGGADMPYAIEISMNRTAPDSSPDCPLGITVSLADDELTEGEPGEATLVLENHGSEPLPMAVAIVGLPGGLEPRHEQLKELVRARSVAAYEVNGREIVLYFRTLEPNAVKRIPLSLVAAVPGTYTGPASRAYLYYGDEHKAWAPGLHADIAAR